MLINCWSIGTFNKSYLSFVYTVNAIWYNAFNVYRRELAPGTVSLTGDRAQGDDSKHWAYSKRPLRFWQLRRSQSEMDEYSHVCVMLTYTGTLSARQAEGCPIFVCSQYIIYIRWYKYYDSEFVVAINLAKRKRVGA